MSARHVALIRLLVLAVVTAAVVPSSAALAAQRDHFRVSVYVLDFDPLMADGSALTVERSWGDPVALDRAYEADVATASSGIVDLRLAHQTTVRTYPAKPGGFVFTNESYLSCLDAASGDRCADLIDYGSVLGTTYDARFGSACEALRRGRVDEVWLWGGPWFGYLEQLAVAPRTLCPSVDRTFVVMGFNYERGEAEMLHDLGHRAESLIQPAIGLALWDRFRRPTVALRPGLRLSPAARRRPSRGRSDRDPRRQRPLPAQRLLSLPVRPVVCRHVGCRRLAPIPGPHRRAAARRRVDMGGDPPRLHGVVARPSAAAPWNLAGHLDRLVGLRLPVEPGTSVRLSFVAALLPAARDDLTV